VKVTASPIAHHPTACVSKPRRPPRSDLLEHVGHPETGTRILSALEDALASGTKIRDLGGSATTEEMTDSVIGRLSSPG